VVPNFNRSLHDSLKSTLPGVPYVTVLTDLADLPPHFWIEPDQEQHFICGTSKAVEQARAMGHAEDRIHATSGMIIRPDFYRPRMSNPAQERVRHGLDPARETGIVMFGGHGSKAMLGIARQLADRQLILVCGHNRALARQLRAEPASAPRLIVEFSRDIPYYMQLADYFIGKPGPGSLSEAVQQGLPVIVVDNAWTMPQERYNASWVREHGLGVVHNSLRTMARAVQELTERLDEYRANVKRIDNRALFEIPPLLASILERSQQTCPLDVRMPSGG
jgi:UDP-N-acetylglucosamine:LPS N-acetylglucosamine transferase